ncbi:hypothetical protein [Arthrobacter sp. VKM Ac-2550]|uniref:hypothetical protein n=1 Tax=Crystallibacter permensis TaxID=1938888 RepID=UPI0022418300|nr:hypothetical protein [Arthrobacter sp. VKM Ac-2550]MCW2132590.1 hypothetical protein [Arthrobacter sp. VKM Ac-2550]
MLPHSSETSASSPSASPTSAGPTPAAESAKRTNVIVAIADKVTSFGVRRAYGEPVQVGSEQVVPVALVQFGFGGGESETGEGGGGGGGMVLPVGVLAPDSQGKASFRPNPLALLVCTVPLVWSVGHAVARVVEACRR